MRFLILLILCSCASNPEYMTHEYEDEDLKTLLEEADNKTKRPRLKA